MVQLIFFLFLFLFPFHSYGEDLTPQETIFFNFADLDKDQNISTEEMDKLIQLIFQLIDVNRDGNISKLEIIELKNIIESLS